MKIKNLKSQKGFTIIEVLIVLAIAGLIMGIVFVAVPALQRNGRTSQRRTDVNTILAAVNEVTANNNGNITTTSHTSGTIRGALSDLSYYEKTGVYVYHDRTDGYAYPAGAWNERVMVSFGTRCNDDHTLERNSNVPARSVSVLFRVETATGGTTRQCIDS